MVWRKKTFFDKCPGSSGQLRGRSGNVRAGAHRASHHSREQTEGNQGQDGNLEENQEGRVKPCKASFNR